MTKSLRSFVVSGPKSQVAGQSAILAYDLGPVTCDLRNEGAT
jgi:hypothetical protein